MRRASSVLLSMYWAMTVLLLSGCGEIVDRASALFVSKDELQKTKCSGTHDGFYVCLSSDSQFKDASVGNAIEQGLAQLIHLVNQSKFRTEITAAFTDGGTIIDNLLATDYIVTITGYCEPNGDALAKAIVGGETIDYNECRVTRDESGRPVVTEIAGVLLHEISHNVGYTHPEVDPSRLTIPYFLGDTAEKDLGGTVKPVGDRVSPDRATQQPGGVTPQGKSPRSRFPRSGN